MFNILWNNVCWKWEREVCGLTDDREVIAICEEGHQQILEEHHREVEMREIYLPLKKGGSKTRNRKWERIWDKTVSLISNQDLRCPNLSEFENVRYTQSAKPHLTQHSPHHTASNTPPLMTEQFVPSVPNKTGTLKLARTASYEK